MRTRLGRLGLRSQFALLALGSMVPLFALLAAGAALQREDTLAFARLRAESLARQGAERTLDAIRSTRSLLTTLSEFPATRKAGPGSCNGTFRRIAKEQPQVRLLVLADAAGRARCGSMPLPAGLIYADRGWFRRAMAPGAGDFVLSRLLVGRVTHVPVIVAAVPLPPAHPGGRPAGVLAASLDLSWLSRRASLARLPHDAVALVLDSRNGAVIAHYPHPGAWIGRRLPEGRLAAALRSRRDGTLDGRGLAGTERIFGLARLPGGSGGTLVVAVGLARSAVLSSALRQEALALTVALLTGLVTLLLAWLIVEFSILRPIHALADTAIRIGGGDHSARPPPLAVTAPEFRTLGIRLADMAERLERAGVALRESEAHFRLLAENTTDVIVRLGPDLARLYVSPVCEELFGYTPAEMLARGFRDDVLAEDAEMAAAMVHGLDPSHPKISLQERFRRKDGRVIWVESNIRWLDDRRGYVVSLRDISARKTIESELEAANRRLELLAWQDGLTGLGNRRSFDRRLDHEYRRAQRSGQPLALILIDVDRFKLFNDMYGHPTGDDCLRAVAAAVDSVLRRPADHGARYGGEEIVMLLPETDEAGANLLAERVCAAVRALGIEHAGNEGGVVTVSAGVAAILPGEGGDSASGLVRAADRALYAAKSAGRNCVRAGYSGDLSAGEVASTLSPI